MEAGRTAYIFKEKLGDAIMRSTDVICHHQNILILLREKTLKKTEIFHEKKGIISIGVT